MYSDFIFSIQLFINTLKKSKLNKELHFGFFFILNIIIFI